MAGAQGERGCPAHPTAQRLLQEPSSGDGGPGNPSAGLPAREPETLAHQWDPTVRCWGYWGAAMRGRHQAYREPQADLLMHGLICLRKCPKAAERFSELTEFPLTLSLKHPTPFQGANEETLKGS